MAAFQSLDGELHASSPVVCQHRRFQSNSPPPRQTLEFTFTPSHSHKPTLFSFPFQLYFFFYALDTNTTHLFYFYDSLIGKIQVKNKKFNSFFYFFKTPLSFFSVLILLFEILILLLFYDFISFYFFTD